MQNLTELHEALARVVLADSELADVLTEITGIARRAMPSIEAVSITLIRGEKPLTAAYDGQMALDADELQYERGYGPCMDAGRAGQMFIIDDMRSEQRWPDYARHAVAHGVLSSLSVQYDQPEHTDEQQPHPGLTYTMQDRPDHGEDSYRGSSRLTGKRAVITGADSGIGRAVALAFAREGADVVLSYLGAEEADADETVSLVEAEGRKAIRCPGDIRERGRSARSIIDTAMQELGGLDILVNNAAYQMAQMGGIADIASRTVRPGDEDQPVRDVLAVQEGHPAPGAGRGDHQHLLGAGGQPVAGTARTTPPPRPASSTSARLSPMELAEKGIRVNVGRARARSGRPLIPATMPTETRRESRRERATGCARGQPAEVAPAYVFFASQESSYITAEMLAVTGGQPVT